MTERTKYIVGNWKMNQNTEDVIAFFDAIDSTKLRHEAWIAPQAIHIPICLQNTDDFKIGAQNCATENSGAFTGEISPASLKDIGAEFVIIGHSERRSIFKEDDQTLNKKTKLALENDLFVIFCIGETLEEREAGKVEEVLATQLAQGLAGVSSEKIIIAYEPVWAIGTGVTASPEQAQEAHAFIRQYINENLSLDGEKTSILYGGSVKPANVEDLLSCKDIDGGLVGGAALKADSYLGLHV
ncbi:MULTISPECIES: triose-phosphate isomerase [unclassified Halobacteriovorax]|uniref:triose-phosphate isomerase n=1 Tax=unclassified Halobacteriovorax TaxID=2639665 RepID=UPI000EA3B3F7|nr:triose-phosphate isomerase [Halobacteriovorax sp. BALOs_7]AYF43538.1 triose-phosphate isomerase [Halobacteriovorax sp. BALOs_7]